MNLNDKLLLFWLFNTYIWESIAYYYSIPLYIWEYLSSYVHVEKIVVELCTNGF